MINLVEGIENQLKADSGMGYFDGNIYSYEHNWTLVENGKAPFVNVECFKESTGEIPGLPFDDAKRHVFDVVIHFCQKSRTKEAAFKGDDSNPGIYALRQKIMDAIKTDDTIGGQARGIYQTGDIKLGFEIVDDSLFLAVAQLEISFYRDVFDD